MPALFEVEIEAPIVSRMHVGMQHALLLSALCFSPQSPQSLHVSAVVSVQLIYMQPNGLPFCLSAFLTLPVCYCVRECLQVCSVRSLF